MPPDRDQPPPPAGADHATILLAEDETLVRMIAAAYLRDCGYRVLEAGDADEAIGLLKANHDIRVVCSDIHMPGGMDGIGLLRWVQRERPGIRVMLVSGAAHAAGQPGEDCPVLAKPYLLDEFE